MQNYAIFFTYRAFSSIFFNNFAGCYKIRVMKKIMILGCLSFVMAVSSQAQNTTNSPYSQFGIGVLSDLSQGFSKGMNGASLGVRKGNVVNVKNPASYSAVDSLTFLFDAGLTGQVTHFKEGAAKINAHGAGFDYAVGSFRLMPHVGMSFGVVPISVVGYQYTTSSYINSTFGTETSTYHGEGGFRQAFIGAGWQVLAPLSIGVNVGYLWGTMDRSVLAVASGINSLFKGYSASANSISANFGLQYDYQLNPKDELTFGLTLGVGHKMSSNPTCEIINVNTADTTKFELKNGLSIPMSYGVGVAWTHDNKLIVDADFTLQKWGSLDFPGNNPTTNRYEMRSDLLKDRYQVAVGLDYVPSELSRQYLNRIHYKFGAGYATPYYYINGKEGPKELSVSLGFGLPLQNAYNSRSVLNVSTQWVHTSATNMITENTFRINIGLTFNERWFSKWKID